MVQRRDSLCYVEFVRGKYMLQNRRYILTLLSNMTDHERHTLAEGPFLSIWNKFWQTTSTNGFVREHENSLGLYNQLRKGYWLRSVDQETGAPKVEFFNLESALRDTITLYTEPEWGFPKGRRNINESDFECAKREFFEETSMPKDEVTILSPCVGPVEEVFHGLNKINYRHVYFVAIANPQSIRRSRRVRMHFYLDPIVIHNETNDTRHIMFRIQRRNKISMADHLPKYQPHKDQNVKYDEREIRNVKWFNCEDVLQIIRPENVARLNMFKALHTKLVAYALGDKFDTNFPESALKMSYTNNKLFVT
jgi:8-oxo-dGTP pyrophosphatase MutT (NUDIX family)